VCHTRHFTGKIEMIKEWSLFWFMQIERARERWQIYKARVIQNESRTFVHPDFCSLVIFAEGADICSPVELPHRTFVHPLNYHPGHLFTRWRLMSTNCCYSSWLEIKKTTGIIKVVVFTRIINILSNNYFFCRKSITWCII